jgi:hypothetical protein
MKKQLLIAAVAASMTSVAMADVSISGAAKFNVKDSVASYSTDLNVVGKAGDTTATYKLKMTAAGFETETATVSTSTNGLSIKAGAWKSGANELDQESGSAVARYTVSSEMGGIKVAVTDDSNGADLTVSGTLAGVSISHTDRSDDTSETTLGATMGGVSVSLNREEDASGNENTATTVSTTMDGVSVKYVNIETDAGTVSDGYVGKFTLTAGQDASAFGISTSVAGNKVTLKRTDVAGTTNNKFVVTRPLNGATFEATYDDNAESLDLELAVKF